MSVALISHADCLLHDMGQSHPEQPARIRSIEEHITQSGLDSALQKFSAPLVTGEQLLRVHDAKYIEHIFQLAPKQGFVALDSDTIMNPHSLSAALHAAGAVVYAVDLIMDGKVKSAFCNIRPPGHHAENATAMGFCIFNNIAIGAAHALEHYKLKRVAIIDFDVHHGNGTEDIIKNNKNILLCSSFQHPFYPYSGYDTKSKHIINIPLPLGTTGQTFREKVTELWLQPIAKFKPQMIFISAGFDAYIEDPLSDLLFTESDYAWITQEIKKIADETAHGRIVSSLEGGYHLEGLGRCVVAHIQALLNQ